MNYNLYDLFMLGKHYISIFTDENHFDGIKIGNGWRFTTRTSGFAFDFDDNKVGIRVAVDCHDENMVVMELIENQNVVSQVSTGKITLEIAKRIPVESICSDAVNLWAKTVFKHDV